MKNFSKTKKILSVYVAAVLLVGGFIAFTRGTSLSAVSAGYIDSVLPDKKMPFVERMVRGAKHRD